MKKSKSLSFLWKFLWVIGLFLIGIISFNYEYQLQQTAVETYNFIPVIWFKLFSSVLLGIYISLAFVRSWSLSINQSLLWCVTLPCLIISLAYPALAMLLSINYTPAFIISSYVSTGLEKIHYSNIFGIVTGISIVLSLFSNQNNKV